MMFVIGTSAQVWPAAGYIAKARGAGARIVTVDPTAEDPAQLQKLRQGDFAFGRDAAKTVPILLEPVIGKLQEDGTFVK
jgi:NAD+-dependent protein deacetylase sirtuin 5